MKDANKIDMSVDVRVEKAIRNAMDIYMNKLATKFVEVELEDTFKMHLAVIIGRELEQNTFFDNERFLIKFEKNMPINGNNNYIDIVIEHKSCSITRLYLIELKFKKVSGSAPALGNIESYKDIYNLDCHKQKNEKVAGCYFIFLTNYKAYLKESKFGTRSQIPMYDSCEIKAKKNYRVTAKAAVKSTVKYPDGFMFSSNYFIEYQYMNMPNVNTKEKDYWFFILKI